jgi:hypothetical protein
VTAALWGVLIFGTVALGSISALAWAAIVATRGEGKQNARATELGVRMEIAQANALTQAARADKEKERADGLDALLDEIALNDDPDTARDHVLSRRARQAGAAAADGGDPGAVPGGGQDSAVAGGSDDALLQPGE